MISLIAACCTKNMQQQLQELLLTISFGSKRK